MGKAIREKFYLEHDWEKIPNWECLFVRQEKKVYFLVCVWGRIKTGWEETNH